MAQIILDSNNNLIQGDFDNATLNNRTKLQTTTTNATTNVYVVPNGSSTSAGVSVANNSSLTNASKIVMATNGTTDTQIISGINGSGTYLPLSFYTNNALAAQISTAGVFSATGGIAASSMPVGSVLQVVSTDYTGLASSTSATPADVSGFAATITPSSASNKILVFVSVAFGFSNDSYPYVLLKRNGTSISVGTSATGTRLNVFLSGTGTNAAGSTTYRFHQASKSFLDSPSSTSALTYQIQFSSPYSGFIAYINRVSDGGDASYVQYPTSSITLMEIKG